MFITLSHHDIACAIQVFEDIEPSERTEQESKTLAKLKLINFAQRQKAVAKGKLERES